MEPTIKLELTIPETNALLNILVSRPYGEVANLLGKIQYQATRLAVIFQLPVHG